MFQQLEGLDGLTAQWLDGLDVSRLKGLNGSIA
jgi:hypothetical protein